MSVNRRPSPPLRRLAQQRSWSLPRTRELLAHPVRVAAWFWTAGAGAALIAAATSPWSHIALLVVLAVSVLCAIAAVVYFVAGERMPSWGLHVGLIVATAVITVGGMADKMDPLYFSVHYIWVIVYAALFFSPRAALIQTAIAAAAYGALLGFGPLVADPVAAWLTVFGTGIVAGAVVLGLVAVLRSDARQDALTGLANRRSWDERLEEEIERARRGQTPLSVAMIDLDDFKTLNDREGHSGGDRVLQLLAAAWNGALRGSGDVLARLGGDEFGVIAPGSGTEGTARLLQRLTGALPKGVSCSIGMATWNGQESAADVMRRADHAMYEAKQARRRDRLGEARDDDPQPEECA